MTSNLQGRLLAISNFKKNFFSPSYKVTSEACAFKKNRRPMSHIVPPFTFQNLRKQVFHNEPFKLDFFGSHGFLKTSQVYYYPQKFLQTKSPSSDGSNEENEGKKMSIFQKFKAMYRDYWYVLVPVHIATSAVWFGTFYYMARSGVDIAALAEMVHLSDETVEKIRKNSNSLAGHLAVSYLLYKVFTPLRYTVTVGGTTISINYLKKWGYIKPIPKKEDLKKMLDDQKASFKKKRENFRVRKDLVKRSVMDKLTQKKRTKSTADLIKKIPQNRRFNGKNGNA